MASQFNIEWMDRAGGRKAVCEPDPAYPYGTASDISGGANAACKIAFPYPAPHVGTWIARCKRCGFSIGVTAAGRADDPTFVTVACKPIGST